MRLKVESAKSKLRFETFKKYDSPIKTRVIGLGEVLSGLLVSVLTPALRFCHGIFALII